MKHFRLPRKTKKAMKKTMWFYPADENGNLLLADPGKSPEDYIAYKQGVLRPLPDKRNSRARMREFREKLNKAVYIPDEELRSYVNKVIIKDFQVSSYNTLIEAKNNKHAVIAYFNFVNAYNIYAAGNDSYGNICCMAVDRAKDLLKRRRK
ncbi:MAG: hypothetical protein JW973_13965 [Bacteroidales bacterium]|nr:hypothetical protein [Bacteroidales bacterium]